MFAFFDWLGDLFAFSLLGLQPEGATGTALQFFVMNMAKILFLLTIVIYAMGWLRAVLTPERVRDFIARRSSASARLMAVGLGSVTPFCSCSSVPLFIGFVKAGIPMGITLSFLIASPMINEVAVVILISVIGWELTLLYVGTGLAVALIGGLVLERLKPERWVESFVWGIDVGKGQEDQTPPTLRERHQFAWGEVKQIVSRIWKFLVIGIAIGAIIHGYIPESFINNVAGDGSVLSVIAAVLVGIPIYADAVSVIPIAESLLGKGVAVGTVMAFMMAVAALSLPEMLILRKVIKWPLLGLFAGYLAIAFVIVGVSFNAIGAIS